MKPPSKEKGVALVLTIAVLSMMLVLLLGYGTLTRTESIASTNYRDFVASKYLAQGALNRSMAEIAKQYIQNSSNYNAGLDPIYSKVWMNDPTTPTGAAKEQATNIETVRAAKTTTVVVDPGADSVTDYVVLAGQAPDPTERAQWIGIKDKTGLFIGREAFIVTAAAIDINTAGNLVPNAFGKMNARGHGYSVAELNLPAALMATDPNTWDYATAVTDAKNVLKYRYGDDDLPGDGTKTMPSALNDGLDNNGNWTIDDKAEGDAGGIPQTALLYSDGVEPGTTKTVHDTFNPQGGDTAFNDLKKLKDSNYIDATTADHFAAAFTEVQKTFVTESALPIYPYVDSSIPSGAVNINDLKKWPDPIANVSQQQNFFDTLLPVLKRLQVPNGNNLPEIQLAANIVEYASATNLPPFMPQGVTLNIPPGTNIVAASRTPLINQVQFDYIMDVDVSAAEPANGNPGEFHVTFTKLQQVPHTELWYPFTDEFRNFDHSDRQPYLEFFATNSIDANKILPTSPTSAQANLTGAKDAKLFVDDADGTAKITFPLPKLPIMQMTNFSLANSNRRFFVYHHQPATFTKGGDIGKLTFIDRNTPDDWGTNDVGTISISNINFQVNLRQFKPTITEPISPILDVANYTTVNTQLLFPAEQFIKIVKAAYTGTPTTTTDYKVTITNTISLTVNDPRAKKFEVEYAGPNDTPLLARPYPINVSTTVTPPGFTWPPGVTSLGCMNFPYAVPNTDLGGALNDWSNPNSQITNTSLSSLQIFAPDRGEDKLYVPDQTAGYTNTYWKGIGPKTFYVKHKRLFSSPVELGRVHNGNRWATIDFTGDKKLTTAPDNTLLDHITTVDNTVKSYVHGRLNINDRPNRLPTWAALFCGMPFESQYMRDHNVGTQYFDLTNTGDIDPNFNFSRAFGEIIGRAAGTFTHMAALTSIGEFSDLPSYGQPPFTGSGTVWLTMKTNEDKEMILDQIFNLIAPRSSGNLFTVWAWGQALTGEPAKKGATQGEIDALNQRRIVSGETLIVAQVRPDVKPDPSNPTALGLKVIYYRFNPDLETNPGW